MFTYRLHTIYIPFLNFQEICTRSCPNMFVDGASRLDIKQGKLGIIR